MPTEITIEDEGIRRAVLYALWTHAAGGISEAFYDRLHLEAQAMLETTGPSVVFHVADDGIGVLRVTMRDVERVQLSKTGATVELEITQSDLAHGLAACASYVQEDEQFWLSDPEERQRRLATFDATQRLLRQFSQDPVVA